jgi:hypothetical protein
MVDLNIEMTVRNELPRISYLLQEILTELKEQRKMAEWDKLRQAGEP